MDILERLANWFALNCDDDWEHSDRITISNIDNPGWCVEISLEDTVLEEVLFNAVKYCDPENREGKWMDCKKEGSVFLGYGSADKLGEILKIFLDWAEQNTDTTPWDAEVEGLFCEIEQSAAEERSEAIPKLRKIYYRFYELPNEHPRKKALLAAFQSAWDKFQEE